jgi:hypothetical protein
VTTRTITDVDETSDILEAIETRLREVREEISRLTAARAALDGAPAAARTRPERTAAKRAADMPSAASTDGRRRRRSRKTRELVPAEKLKMLLSDVDGLSTSDLAERARGDQAQILGLLREMEKADVVRRTGHARATRWHLITDEQRIQERAAELAARSKEA